jgi:hypothetical protein
VKPAPLLHLLRKQAQQKKQYEVLKKSGILDYRFGTGLDLLSPAIFIYYPA